MEHFYDALTAGKADAALAASLFHYKELEIRQVKAPVKKGDVVGKAVYRLNGQEIGSVRLISSQEVRKAGYGDALKKAAGYLVGRVRL